MGVSFTPALTALKVFGVLSLVTVSAITLVGLIGSPRSPNKSEESNHVGELREYFEDNRSDVLRELQTQLNGGKYNEAYLRGKTFLNVSTDEDLRKLVQTAEEEVLRTKLKDIGDTDTSESLRLYQRLLEITPGNTEYLRKLAHFEAAERAQQETERQKEIAEIRAKLKAVPASELETNLSLYNRLVELDPSTDEFKRRADDYGTKIKEREAKKKVKADAEAAESQQRIARFGQPPIRSPWDGSYRPVETYLQRIANDPDSIEIDECTKVYHTSSGWLVGCDYRGRNAFNGMIRQSNWFTIVRGNVVKMEEASAYTP